MIPVVHVYQTDFGVHQFDPKWFEAHMTEAAHRAGDRAMGDMRFKVAKAIKAWAEEKDAL